MIISGQATFGDREIRVTRVSVTPLNEPLFSEMVTHVEIDDEAGGEFVAVRQQSGHVDSERQRIAIDVLEWPALREAIEFMFQHCCRKEDD